MPRYEVGLHCELVRELSFRVAMLACGVAVLGGATIVGLTAEGGPGCVLIGLIGVIFVFLGWGSLRHVLRIRRRVLNCGAGAALVRLRVLEDEKASGSGLPRQLRLQLDTEGSRAFDWSVVERQGTPIVLSDDPPMIAALRAEMPPHSVVPFMGSGYPFAMSSETRRAILGGTHRQELRRDVVGRPELPCRFGATTRVASGQRAGLIACAALSVASFSASLFLEYLGAQTAVLVGSVTGLAILFLAPLTRAAFGRLLVDDRGVALASWLGGGRVVWGDLDRVVVRGVDTAARGRSRVGRLGGAIGGFIGGIVVSGFMALAPRRSSNAEAGASDSDSYIDRRLADAGRGRPGFEPEIELFRSDGTSVLLLRCTHDWDVARALAAEAVARGADLHTG